MSSIKLHRLGAILMLLVLATNGFGQATHPTMNEYRPGGYPESYHGVFYPGTEVRALPVARAQAVAARAEYQRAESDLDRLIANAQLSFAHSKQWTEAVAEDQAAYEAFQAIRKRKLSALQDDSSYQTAAALRDRLSRQIEQTRDKPHTTIEHLFAMASVKLSYAATAAAMEVAAISAAPEANQARQRLLAAGRRLSELRWQFEDALRNSPEVAMARKAVADTRTAALAADAIYGEARNVANVAMDYAYHMYNHPYPYVINSPYYGAGYGYTVNYPIGYPRTWWNTSPGK